MSLSVSRRRFVQSAASLAVLGAVPVIPFRSVAAAAPSNSGSKPTSGPLTADVAPDVLLSWIQAVFDQVKSERFTPTSAARAYAYVALAGYEAVVGGMPAHRSLSGQLNDFAGLKSTGGHDWAIALNEAIGITAAAAFADRSAASRDALAAHRAATAASLASGVPRPILDRSVAHGRRIGEAIAARSMRDNYLATRGLPYTPPVGPDLWERTPPNFGAAIEPHWGQVLSFTMAANDQFRPAPPVPYSEEVGSAFWQQAKATHDAVNGLDDDQRRIALSWRDNPDGTTGLPSGHWMRITGQIIEQKGHDLAIAAEALALVGLSLADGFTSCWTEKYQTNLLRPVTYIRRHIDPNWASFVNSPAFPEYTSGHSVGSAAAAETLTHLFGNVSFTDDVGVANGFPIASFGSPWEAANEAAISRLYGGIHYPMGIEAGLDQGRSVSQHVLATAQTRRGKR